MSMLINPYKVQPPTASGPAFVQQKTNTATDGATLVVTLDASPTVGNSLIAAIGHAASRTVTGITGGGVTWAQGPHDETNRGVDIWYGHVSDGSSAVITITLNSGIVSAPSANISEWSGLNNAAPESTNTNTGALDTVLTSNSVSSPTPKSLVIATFATAGGNYSSGPTNGFTRLTQAGTVTVLDSAYQIETATGTYSTGFTYTAGLAWGAAIASFGSGTASSVLVAGAGTAAANGVYTLRGTNAGKPYYNLVGELNNPGLGAISWDGGNWAIFLAGGGDTLYNNLGEDVAFPWLSAEWQEVDGAAPPPTVTEQP